jgi:hypothetical protein
MSRIALKPNNRVDWEERVADTHMWAREDQKAHGKSVLILILILLQVFSFMTSLGEKRTSLVGEGDSVSQAKELKAKTDQYQQLASTKKMINTGNRDSTSNKDLQSSNRRSQILSAGGMEFIGTGDTNFQAVENFTGWNNPDIAIQNTAPNPDYRINGINIGTPTGWTPEAGWIDISGVQALA